MAIQFNCPYCTVTIQVPDNAAGKKGTCPQCGTKVVVPVPRNTPPLQTPVAPPPNFVPTGAESSFAQNANPAAYAVAPPFMPQPTPVASYPPASGVPFGFDPSQAMPTPTGYPPAGFVAPQTFVPQTTVVSEPSSGGTSSRKRKKRGVAPVVWGLAVVVIIVGGILAYFFLKPGSKPNPMIGTLTATRLANGKLKPTIVHREWLEGIDEETVSTVLKQMEKRTITLRGDMVILKFQGVPEGIKITATPGLHGELIAIDIASNKPLNSWQQKHSAKLSDRHQREVIRAAKSFVQEWAKAEAAGEKKFDFSRYHDDLGIASLTSGLGAELIAIIDKTIYGCVAEQEGLVYFLLPPGTERFELQGREDAKGNVVFPGKFVVDIEAGPPSKKTDKTKSPDDDSEAMQDDDAEMKTKSFGKPALNDPSAVDESMPEKSEPKKSKSKKKSADE